MSKRITPTGWNPPRRRHYSDEIEPDPPTAHDLIESCVSRGAELVGDRLAQRMTPSPRSLMFSDTTPDLRAALPESAKRGIHRFEAMAKRFPQDSAFRSAETLAATAQWFEQATKGQVGKFSGEFDRQAFEKLEEGFERAAGWTVTKTTLEEDTDNLGGYGVPTLVGSEVHRLILDASDLWPRCRQVELQSKVTNLPAQNTAVTVNWITEGEVLTQGEPTFSQVVIQADKLAGRAKFSIELLQDSAPNMLSYLLSVFTEKMAGELDYRLVLGDGTSPELLGIVNDGAVVRDTLSTQAALSWARLATGFTSAGENWARSGGAWVMSPKGYSSVIGLSDSAGMPVVQYANTSNAPAGTLLGRPIVVSNRFGGSGTLDNTTLTKTEILFGPPQALIAGSRQRMSWDVTDSVGWANYEMDARLIGRFGARPVVPAAWVRIEQVSYT